MGGLNDPANRQPSPVALSRMTQPPWGSISHRWRVKDLDRPIGFSTLLYRILPCRAVFTVVIPLDTTPGDSLTAVVSLLQYTRNRGHTVATEGIQIAWYVI